jgi:hypothetical protein
MLSQKFKKGDKFFDKKVIKEKEPKINIGVKIILLPVGYFDERQEGG